MATTSRSPVYDKSNNITGYTVNNSNGSTGTQNAAGGTTSKASSVKDTPRPEGIAYQSFNPDGSIRSSLTSEQLHAQNASDIASGKDTPEGVGGIIDENAVSSAPIPEPVTPANTPVNTAQPSPTTANATPYTSTSTPASTNPVAAAHAIASANPGPAPQDAGVGKSVAANAIKTASDSQGYVSPAPVVQAYAEATKKLTEDYNKAMSSEGQGKSLVEQYQDFTKQLGIPALNTELMNMKNVIDGTEDDIRNEVTKAGGFATDSQVLAMTNSRNKVMIQNYNNLLQTRSDAMQQVQTMVGLAAQDREYMSKQIDRQLNFDQQQVQFAEKALTNAQSSIEKSIANYGAASVLKQALATGDPTAVARINATMGNGFDLREAAAHLTLDEQMKKANIAQSYASINASNAAAEHSRAETYNLTHPTAKPQTQAQVIAQGYAERANSANAIISKFGNKFANGFAQGGATIFGIGVPNFLKSQDRKDYEQAQRQFVNAVLRPESGASISPTEFESAAKEYFPQPGDSNTTVRNKAVDRQLKINSLQIQGTNVSVPEAGQVVNYQGIQYTVDANGEMTPI